MATKAVEVRRGRGVGDFNVDVRVVLAREAIGELAEAVLAAGNHDKVMPRRRQLLGEGCPDAG